MGRAMAFLARLAQEEPRVQVHTYEIEGSPENLDLFIRANRLFDIAGPAVPLIVIGDEARIGFLSDATTGREIARRVDQCLQTGCDDSRMRLLLEGSGEAPGRTSSLAGSRTPLPETISLPFVGSLSTAALSLPLLTMAFALVDGFNPCAMWVLVFLIGLLLGVEDRLRMWLLGGVFIVASAAVYYALMTAWLNVLLVIDTRLWIRVAVGILALGGAAYYVNDYIRNPMGACAVTGSARRRYVLARLGELVKERRLWLAAAGVAGLAVAVNVVELLCSAGLPAVYAQVLTKSELPRWQYYGYVLLYVTVFMLDDLAVFVVAMVTLRLAGLTGKFERHMRLVGGVLLAGVGALLIFRPEWLTFA
jgi:hypothetical protein